MKPKWQKLDSLAQEKYVHSSFSSLVQSLLPYDTLLRTYLTQSGVRSTFHAVRQLPAVKCGPNLLS